MERNTTGKQGSLFKGQRLKEIRIELGLTQKQVSEELKTEQATVSLIENNGAGGVPLFAYLELISKKGYNVNWVIIEDNNLIPKKEVLTIKKYDFEVDYSFLLQVSKSKLESLSLLEEYVQSRGVNRFDEDGFDYLTIIQAKLIGIIK